MMNCCCLCCCLHNRYCYCCLHYRCCCRCLRCCCCCFLRCCCWRYPRRHSLYKSGGHWSTYQPRVGIKQPGQLKMSFLMFPKFEFWFDHPPLWNRITHTLSSFIRAIFTSYFVQDIPKTLEQVYQRWYILNIAKLPFHFSEADCSKFTWLFVGCQRHH